MWGCFLFRGEVVVVAGVAVAVAVAAKCLMCRENEFEFKHELPRRNVGNIAVTEETVTESMGEKIE